MQSGAGARVCISTPWAVIYLYALCGLTFLLGFTLTLHVVRGYEESGEWTV